METRWFISNYAADEAKKSDRSHLNAKVCYGFKYIIFANIIHMIDLVL